MSETNGYKSGSNLEKVLRSGAFAVTAELGPPKNADPEVIRHKAGLLKTEFSQPLGKVVWQVPCHQRVQNIGPKTRDILALVPDTEVEMIERCSGHDGTYGVRAGTYEKSQKIARPVINRAKKAEPDYLVSDCPMAATQIANGLELKHPETNPLTLLRKAYGI